MQETILRYGSLILITFIVLLQSYLSNDPMVNMIIILTFLLLFYFLIPVFNRAIINYVMIVTVFALSVFFNVHIEYLLVLISFFILEGTFILMARHFYIFITYLLVVCIGLVIFSYLTLNNLLLVVLLVICASFLLQTVIERKEKNELYDQLLSQYRKLKRLSVEQEQLVRAEERTKIARDMHDSVGHKLTALLMQLEVMDIKNEDTNLQHIKLLARDSLEETRFAVRQLKVNESSGIQSVVQLIRKLEMESHLVIKFTLEKGILSIPLTNNQSIILYRVLQESLTNAMKHSESKEVEVTIGTNSLQHVQFSVKNKIYSQMPLVQGFGLTNMKERLQEIGGELRVTKNDQQFIVVGTFPLRREV